MSISVCLGFDLETTGLNVQEDSILEVAVARVFPDFSIDSEREWAIHYDDLPVRLERCSPEVLAQHERSGLIEACRKSPFNLNEVENKLNEYVTTFWGERDRPMLLGNSVHFDRRFIRAQMSSLDKRLHYRLIDVSSIREAVKTFGAKHRAQVDVRDSVRQLQTLLEGTE